MFIFPRIFLPTNNDLPPTLYAIMNSMVNYNVEEKTKIKDLASECHNRIFDFTYPLSNKINKDDFEIMILNHFLMRRISYESMTAFQISLNVKLNEIMPMYNKMFDMLDSWDLFNDGEIYTRQVADGRITQTNGQIANNIATTNVVNATTSQNGNDVTQKASTSDRRFSELPQNQLSDLRNGNYVTDYNYDTNNDTINNTSTSTSSDNQTSNNITNNNTSSSNNITDNGTLSENITRTPADKMRIYKEFMENKQSIMTMIFKDLDCLFYGLV